MRKIFDVLWNGKEHVEMFVDDVFEASELKADSIKYDRLTCYVDGKETDVTGYTWAGYPKDKDDLLRKLIAEYVNYATYITFNHVADEVKALRENDNNIRVFTSEGREIPSVYYTEWFETLDCMIDYIADGIEYVYYAGIDEDNVLLDAKTGKTISDNNFAFDGMLDDLSKDDTVVNFHNKSFEECLADYDIQIA